MSRGTKRFSKMSRAVPANQDQALREIALPDAAHSIQAFTNRLGHSFRHTLVRNLCQLTGQLMRLFFLDIEAHFSTLYRIYGRILP